MNITFVRPTTYLLFFKYFCTVLDLRALHNIIGCCISCPILIVHITQLIINSSNFLINLVHSYNNSQFCCDMVALQTCFLASGSCLRIRKSNMVRPSLKDLFAIVARLCPLSPNLLTCKHVYFVLMVDLITTNKYP